MTSFIHGNSKFSTFDLSESKCSKNEHQTQFNDLPAEKKTSSEGEQMLVGKSKSSHCPKFGFMANKKDKEETATAEKMNPMSRWESEGRVDAPWCIVNIVNKRYIHQPVGPKREGKEDQWSLDGECGSS
jgi:hypothetical protein